MGTDSGVSLEASLTLDVLGDDVPGVGSGVDVCVAVSVLVFSSEALEKLCGIKNQQLNRNEIMMAKRTLGLIATVGGLDAGLKFCLDTALILEALVVPTVVVIPRVDAENDESRVPTEKKLMSRSTPLLVTWRV